MIINRKLLRLLTDLGPFKYLHSAGWHSPSVYYWACSKQSPNLIYTQWGCQVSLFWPLAISGLKGTRSGLKLPLATSCVIYHHHCYLSNAHTAVTAYIMKHSLGISIWDIFMCIVPIKWGKNILFLTGNGVDSSLFCLQVNLKWLNWQ